MKYFFYSITFLLSQTFSLITIPITPKTSPHVTGTTMGDNGSLVNSGVGAISGSATTASLSGLSWLQGGGGLSVDAEASSVVSNASHGSIGHSSLDDR